MTNGKHEETPFTLIIDGSEPGEIIARDDEKQFALIVSFEPEAAVHWIALPFDGGYSTEQMENEHSERFRALLDWTIQQTKARIEAYPELEQGFTIKMHFGAYETVPHAKLHVLSSE